MAFGNSVTAINEVPPGAKSEASASFIDNRRSQKIKIVQEPGIVGLIEILDQSLTHKIGTPASTGIGCGPSKLRIDIGLVGILRCFLDKHRFSSLDTASP